MADDQSSPAASPLRAYRVLARKYRPQSFADLIGQEAMVRTLSNAFESGRLPQAWMLTGVRGVGKTTTARILARALNYQLAGTADRPTIDMPTNGVHCEAIIEGRHIDVMEIDAASHTGIDDIRDISDAARYTPMSARYKVYIIDEVHMLSKAAFNGLLKTLEEPPAHVKFIFATTEIRKVPVTVLSRCQRFDLRRVDIEVLAAHLHRIAGAEAMALADDAARLIARVAEGSVRDALSLLDQANAAADGDITAEAVRHMLGLADGMRVLDLVEALMRGDAREALQLFAAQYRDGADPAVLVGELADAVHLLTRAKIIGNDLATGTAPEAERQRLAALSSRLTHATLSRAWQMLLKGIDEVKDAPRPASAVDMLLIRLCHVAELPSPEELVRRLERQEGGGPDTARDTGQRSSSAPVARYQATEPPSLSSPRPAQEAARQPSMVARATPLAAAEPRTDDPTPAPRPSPSIELQRFEDLVALAQHRRDIKLKLALERSVHLVAFEPGRIELRLKDTAASWLVQDVQRKLQEWTGERWLVVLSQEDGQPTLEEKAAEERRSMVDDVRADPAVAAILARFPGAEIVDVQMRGDGENGEDGALAPSSPDDEEQVQ